MQHQADAQWLQQAIRAYEGPLIHYVTRMLGDLDAARDVVQEAFLRLCSQDRDGVADHLAEWLFAVCRNLALDIKRKQGRLSTLSEERADLVRGQSPPPDEVIEERDAASHALKLLENLPESQQEVVILKFQHGLSYRQIAHVTGLTVTNVGFLIHTAIKTLRNRMNAPCRCE